MIATATDVASTVTFVTPTIDTVVAEACNVVHTFEGEAWSLAIANANSTPPSDRPVRCPVVPFEPANAVMFAAPIVNRLTFFVDASSSVIVSVDFRSANVPLAVKKPLTSSANAPDTSNSGPDWPVRSSERVVLGPVRTVSGAAAKSINTPFLSGRLIDTPRFEPDSVRPSIP